MEADVAKGAKEAGFALPGSQMGAQKVPSSPKLIQNKIRNASSTLTLSETLLNASGSILEAPEPARSNPGRLLAVPRGIILRGSST